MPWRKALENDKSELSQLVTLAPKIFTGRHKVLVHIANLLKISDNDIKDCIKQIEVVFGA